MYSLAKFIRNLFGFIINNKNSDYKFGLSPGTKVLEDLTEILKMEGALKEKMSDYSVTYYNSRYNSIDVTKKSMISELDEEQEKKNSNIMQEDVVELYEQEYEAFIEKSEELKKLNNIAFFQKDNKSYRFCGFCLNKKVIVNLILA